MGGIYAVYGYMAIVSFGLFFSLLRAVEVILDVDVISECKLNLFIFEPQLTLLTFFSNPRSSVIHGSFLAILLCRVTHLYFWRSIGK